MKDYFIKKIRRLPHILLILLAFIAVFFSNASASSVEKLWEYHPQAGFVDTSPAIGDLDEDGIKDLVFCTVAGRVLALNSLGLRIWHYDAKETITTPPLIDDIDHNGTKNVLVYTNKGKIICLNGVDGRLIWQYNMPSGIIWGSTSLAVCDLFNNGNHDIIAADNNGNLICLNGKGKVIWRKKFKDKFNSAPATGYLTNKQEKNILIGSDSSPLICLSAEGKELWRITGEESSSSSPLIADLDGNGNNEIIVGSENLLLVFDNRGKKLWQYKMKGSIHDGISFADLDDDNRKEIIVADLRGNLDVLNYNGTFLWKHNLTQRIRRSATIGDIDGDFKAEILAAGYSSDLFVYSKDGSLKDQIPLNGGMNASPTIVDFKNDGKICVVCGANSGIMAFTWLDKTVNNTSAILFGEYRCNSRRTGGMIKHTKSKNVFRLEVDYGGQYTGDNTFHAKIYNPSKKKLTLRLSIKKDGIINNRNFSSSDTLFHGRIFYNLYGRQAHNLEFKAVVSEKGKTLMQKSYACYITPFNKDIYDLKETLAYVKSIAKEKQATNAYNKEQIIIFTQRLKDIEEQALAAATMPMLELSLLKNNLAVLRKDLNTFKQLLKASLKTKKHFAVYSANPWAPFGGIEEIEEGRTPMAHINIEAFSREIECAAVNIANFFGRALTVRIEALSLMKAEDSTIIIPKNVYEFHDVIQVPTQMLDYSADALPLMNQAHTIMIPNYDLRQIWVNVDTKPLTPGTWKGIIILRSLEVEAQEIQVPVTIKVWHNDIPSKQPVHLCHWGYVHTSRLKDHTEEAFLDQVQHGTNVFVATSAYAPAAKFDAQGNITGKIDYSKLDEYVKKHAKNNIILFFGYQSKLKGPAKPFSSIWEKAYKTWIKKWIEHLKGIGITYEQFAFYPIDEPGLKDGLVDNFVSLSKPIREVDPQANIYTDPVGRASMSDLKKMSPYVDIWCPNRNGYLLNDGQDKLSYLKSTGKKVWTYECIGNAKHLSPLGYYRAQAWLIWHYGLSGMGFWSYCTSSADPWSVPKGTLDYLLIYQGDGVVSSKRWEAIRDGVEDYGILSRLRKAVEKSTGKAPVKLINKAEKLLNDDVYQIARYCGLDEYGNEPGIGGMKERRIIEDMRWHKIKTVRHKIALLLQELSRY